MVKTNVNACFVKKEKKEQRGGVLTTSPSSSCLGSKNKKNASSSSSSTSSFSNPFHQAIKQGQRVMEEKKRKRLEHDLALKRKQELFLKNKQTRLKKLKTHLSKTKKGQPNLNAQMESLYNSLICKKTSSSSSSSSSL
ncbi:hypothetical protein HMI54_001425 [Coelomomyces lativittatus]|nr:hypothetical protein HMI54_001425 [Coelomomyces lativittatus]KAJ1510865.1 hypothetical protein HMI56_006102 [Coelomomyces lativittatus]